MIVGMNMGPGELAGKPLDQHWNEMLEQVRAARDHGFGRISIGHHWVIHPFQYFNIIPWLARIAPETGKMLLNTGVILLPLMNPVEVAEQMATLDYACEGRLRVGLGLGYRPLEFEFFGISLKHRAPRFEESLTLMKRLWTEDEVTHRGRFFHITGAKPTLKPLQKPYPPIWIAANSDPAIRRAARMGDAVYIAPFGTYDVVKRQVGIYREELKNVGKPWPPKEMVFSREYTVGRTRAEAVELGREGMRRKWEAYAEHGLQASLPEDDKRLLGDFEALAKDTFVLGDPAECAEEILRYREMGFNHINLRIQYPGLTHAEMLQKIKLTEQVIKRLPAGAER